MRPKGKLIVVFLIGVCALSGLVSDSPCQVPFIQVVLDEPALPSFSIRHTAEHSTRSRRSTSWATISTHRWSARD